MDIDTIKEHSLYDLLYGIAQRVKERRLEQNLTQKAFAKRAGVGYDLYRKFEHTGEMSIRNLILCAIVIDDVDGFAALFEKKTYRSIDDLLCTKATKRRKRGSQNE